jgi:hypothetical protein
MQHGDQISGNLRHRFRLPTTAGDHDATPVRARYERVANRTLCEIYASVAVGAGPRTTRPWTAPPAWKCPVLGADARIARE